MIARGIRARRVGAVCLLVFLLLLVGGAGPSSSADPEASEREIEALRAEIAQRRERVGGAEQAERDLLRRIQELDRGLDELRVQVDRSRIRAEEKAAVHARVEGERGAAEARLEATRRAMAKRAVALYKAGEVGPLQVLFASTDLPQMLGRMGDLERLLVHDADLVERSIRERARVHALETEAAEAQRESEVAHARLGRRSQALGAERRARSAALETVRADQTRERALLLEVESAARKLQETLARMEAGKGGFSGTRFAARRGKLPRPVRGGIRRPFGRLVDPKYQTEIFHKGLEIDARRGDRVRAVAPGRVRLAGWFRGYGKLVIVDHGEGYFTVSGHLADIYVEVGDAVTTGDTLGTVGDTGSLEGPGLYFEVRRGSGPLNPAEWLAKG